MNESDTIPCMLCKGLPGFCMSMDLNEEGVKSGDGHKLGDGWERQGGVCG